MKKIIDFLDRHEAGVYFFAFVGGLLALVMLPSLIRFTKISSVFDATEAGVRIAGYILLLSAIFFLFLSCIAFMFPAFLCVRKFYGIVLWVLLAFFSMNLLVQAYFNFRSPSFFLDHIEQTLFLQSVRFMSGIFPYNDPEKLPVISMLYSFLYQGINAFLMKLSGISIAIPKMTSFAYSGLTIALIFYYLRRLRVSRPAVLFGLASFLIIAPTTHLLWARVDPLSLLLSTLVLIILYYSSKPMHYLIVLLLIAAAYFTKQTAVYLFLFSIIYMLMSGRFKNKAALCLFLLFPVFILIAVYLLEVLSGKQYLFWTVVVPSGHTMLPLKLILKRSITYFLRFLSVPLLPVCLILIAGKISASGSDSNDDRINNHDCLKYWLVHAVVAVLILTVPVNKYGGFYNSYLPMLGGFSILGSILLDRFFDRIVNSNITERKANRYVYAKLILIFFVVLMLFSVMKTRENYFVVITRSDRYKLSSEEYAEAASYVKEVSDSHKLYFARGAKPLDGHKGCLGFQDCVIVNAEKFTIWDDEAALVDYLFAGFRVPSRIEQNLKKGDIQKIIVKKGYLPFMTLNYYSVKSEELNYTYPESIRDAFFGNFEKEQNNLRFFDVYNYKPQKNNSGE